MSREVLRKWILSGLVAASGVALAAPQSTGMGEVQEREQEEAIRTGESLEESGTPMGEEMDSKIELEEEVGTGGSGLEQEPLPGGTEMTPQEEGTGGSGEMGAGGMDGGY